MEHDWRLRIILIERLRETQVRRISGACGADGSK
jgi:hypothetical protein